MKSKTNQIVGERKNNKKKIIFIVFLSVVLLIGIVVGYTSAYFTSTVLNNPDPSNITVQTGIMEVEFTDGATVILDNAMPGSYIEKTFKVENVGTVSANYDIYMSDLINTFADKTDLVYTLTSNDGGYNVSTQTQVPDTNTKIVSAKEIGVGQSHNYTLRIDFLETNDNQDGNKGKTFSTIIRVNEVQDAKYIAQQIESYSATDSSLVYDGTADNNLRYIGANPNNYIRFNDELWRIIGVMNNVETESGQTETLVKIIRNESLGMYSWDSSEGYLPYNSNDEYNSCVGINCGYGINQWGESGTYEGADLMRELNYDYLGNITVGTNEYWFSGYNNIKAKTKPSSTLNAQAQSMIESVVWNLGSPNSENDKTIINYEIYLVPDELYLRERADSHGKNCESASTACNDTITRTTSWTGKIGLMYPSDYGFATGGGSSTNREVCLESDMDIWAYGESELCPLDDWLYLQSVSQSTMSPFSFYDEGYSIFAISEDGSLYHSTAASDSAVKPTLFLKATTVISGGEGTEANPYTLN